MYIADYDMHHTAAIISRYCSFRGDGNVPTLRLFLIGPFFVEATSLASKALNADTPGFLSFYSLLHYAIFNIHVSTVVQWWKG